MLKKIKLTFIIISVIELSVILHAIFSIQDVLTLLNGSTKILSAKEFSKDMEYQDLYSFINQILNKETSDIIEYKEGYELLIGIKEGNNTEEEFANFMGTKDKEYKSIINILKMSQWVALSLFIVDIVLGVYYFVKRRRLKNENIS